ncbi:MAG TPA: alpha/beta hydrolase [Kiritimatiellia bacterium]|nr:alpha/beta hydrolase [Kiritimatiellia bacterium]
MSTKTVIVHGWSDTSESFHSIKEYLVGFGSLVDEIYFADYQSLEDSVTFNDIVDGFNDQMIKRSLIAANGETSDELNLIVHSTGGLVVRHWISHFYRNKVGTCPVKRIIMLAPANFGSTLAHRGRSFFGRIGKGQKDLKHFGEVGTNLLLGLELGSPYLWWLAEQDLLSETHFYGRSRIQVTILVGADGYDGLLSLISKDGTDGVVVIPGTSLDVRKYILDFCPLPGYHEAYSQLKVFTSDSSLDVAFGILPGLNHSTIVNHPDYKLGNKGHPYHSVLNSISRALTTKTEAAFVEWVAYLRDKTEEVYANNLHQRYQQFVFRALDDFNKPIMDYYITFGIVAGERKGATYKETIFDESDLTDVEHELSDKWEKCFTDNFHRNTQDPSYRQAIFKVSDARSVLDEAQAKLGHYLVVMWIDVPEVDRGITYAISRKQVVVVYDSQSSTGATPDSFLFENNTTMVELRVDRKTKYVTITKA